MQEITLGILSLICVISIFVLLMYFYKKMNSHGMFKSFGSKYMQIIDRLSINRNSYLALVRIINKYYIVSVSPEKVQIQCEIDIGNANLFDIDLQKKETFIEKFKVSLKKYKDNKATPK